MADRKAVSTRTRFRVFERDAFRCQYCGRGTPEVVLEIDHLIPVSQGGKNCDDNLLTACKPCNSGKSDRVLQTGAPGPAERNREAREKEAQIEAYRELLSRKAAREAAEAKWVESLFLYYFGWSDVWPQARATIRNQLQRIDCYEIRRCIEIAAQRCECFPIEEPVSQFRYYCGVINGRERRRREGAPE